VQKLAFLPLESLAYLKIKALYYVIVAFKTKTNLRWIGAEVRDSCGSSGTGETHADVYAEEAHRPPRGKRASLAAINRTALLGITTKFEKAT
jgi:hypothetical protein